MILPRQAAAATTAPGGGTILLDDDNRALASYGIQGRAEYDDIVPLEMVVVASLTPEQIEARQQEVYDAANQGDTARCQTSIQAANDEGVDLNWQNPKWPHGSTSVFIAASNGHEGCLAQLIAAGADVNIPNKSGRTPVYIAVYRGNDRCLAQLIAAGADVNIPEKNGQTPVWIAANTTTREVVLAQLIAADADVNIPDNNGRTPSYAAAYNGYDGSLVQLIMAGADVNIADNSGETPLQTAIAGEFASTTKLLRDAGAE